MCQTRLGTLAPAFVCDSLVKSMSEFVTEYMCSEDRWTHICTYIDTHAYTRTTPRTSIYVSVSRNTSLLGFAPGSLFVRFNTSSPTLVPAQIMAASTILALCPPFARAGPCTAQIVIGQTGAVLGQFTFAYVWPTTEVSPAKLPKSGGSLTLKVCVAAVTCMRVCTQVGEASLQRISVLWQECDIRGVTSGV